MVVVAVVVVTVVGIVVAVGWEGSKGEVVCGVRRATCGVLLRAACCERIGASIHTDAGHTEAARYSPRTLVSPLSRK